MAHTDRQPTQQTASSFGDWRCRQQGRAGHTARLATSVHGRAQHGAGSSAGAYLGVVHVPQEAVGLGVQDEIPPQKPAAGLIFLNVQEPADTVLPIHVRHAGLLLASPCRGGTGRERWVLCSHSPSSPGSCSCTHSHLHPSMPDMLGCQHSCSVPI